MRFQDDPDVMTLRYAGMGVGNGGRFSPTFLQRAPVHTK
jgi:hypothetical protein